MQGSDKNKIILIAALAGVIGFFLPWISAGWIGNFSGYDIYSFGSKLRIENSWALLLIPISLSISFFLRLNVVKDVAPALVKVIEIIPFGLFAFATFKLFEITNLRLTDFDESVLKTFGLGFYLSLIASIIVAFSPRPEKERYKDLAHNQEILTPPNIPSAPSPSPAPIKIPFDYIAFFKRNIKYFAGATVIVVSSMVLFTIWSFFIKADPISDGKSIANSYCDCDRIKSEESIKIKLDFVDGFSSFNFKNKTEAGSKLTQLLQSPEGKYLECLEKTREKENKKRSNYIGYAEDVSKFSQALYQQRQLCYKDYSYELSSAESKQWEKLNSLSDESVTVNGEYAPDDINYETGGEGPYVDETSFQTYNPCGFKVSLPVTYKLIQDGEMSSDYCDFYVNLSSVSKIRLSSLTNSRFDASGIQELYDNAVATSQIEITYKSIKDNWFVISGRSKDNNQIVYLKRVWGDTYVSDLHIEYSENDKSAIEPHLSKISQTFTSL